MPIVWKCVAIILVMDLLLAPSHICEHALMEGVLVYDHANVMTLNWVSIIGVIIGILFTWQTFARRKWTYQNMFSAALAAPIGNAIVGRALKVITTRNTMFLSQNMDSVTLSTSRVPMGELYGMVQVQSLMESMKEIYGLLLFVAILCLIILMLRYSSFRPLRVIEPTYRFIYNFCKKEVFARLRVRRIRQVS